MKLNANKRKFVHSLTVLGSSGQFSSSRYPTFLLAEENIKLKTALHYVCVTECL